MKITPEHLAHLRAELERVIAQTGRERIAAYKDRLRQNPAVKNVDKRLMWDLFNGAQLHLFACSTLYAYLNDAHIDTALRYLAKELRV